MTTDNADQPATTAGPCDDKTVIVPPPHAAHEQAWSLEEPETVTLRQPWGQAWSAAAVVLICAAVIAIGIGGWALLQNSQPSQAPVSPTALPTSSATAQHPGSAAPPSTVTVTAAPPTTVTVQAPPATAEPAALPPNTDVFNICPDGQEGVVGGRTSCAFAANVRHTFYATGMSNHFTAFSPVTGAGYEMTCVGRYPAYFTDGSTKISTRCYGGDNAEVVVW